MTMPGVAPDRQSAVPSDDDRRTRRRLLVAVAVVVLAALLAALAVRSATDAPPPDAGPTPGTSTVDDTSAAGEELDGPTDPDPDHALDETVVVDRAGGLNGFPLGDEVEVFEDGDSFSVDLPDVPPPPGGDGDVGDGGTGGGDVGPDAPDDPGTNDPEPPADPCASVEAGAHLVVTPDPRNLPLGQMTSNLTIHNCGPAAVDWTAATKPSVKLSDAHGSLAAGTSHKLGFEIDAAKFATNDISFKIKVSEPGHNVYADVHATKLGLAPNPKPSDPEPEPGLTNGTGDGCASQCITKAWLTPNATTPNVGLEVKTRVDAHVVVFVSEDAPVDDGHGHPVFPGVAPIASSNGPVSAWTTLLEPLQPSTDYHLIVTATDDAHRTSYRAGAFKTIKAAIDPDLGVTSSNDGCLVQCITKAWLTPDIGSPDDLDIEVKTHTPATIEVSVDDAAPQHDPQGHPSFPGVEPAATSMGEPTRQFNATLAHLEPGTKYAIIVKATDAFGRSSFREGTFVTHLETHRMRITFLQVHVVNDGDASLGNRGELEVRFAINGELVASTGEKKLHSNTTLHLDDGDRMPGISEFVDGVGDFLPLVTMVGNERDADGLVEFCSAGTGVPNDWGRLDGCDLKWNVAGSGIITDGLDGMVPCAQLGIDGDAAVGTKCLRLETVSHGEDYPTFDAIASFQLLDE
jgi:hypothetical protein